MDTRGTYVFDVRSRSGHHGYQLHRAVSFAQQQVLREVEKQGFNILLIEGYVISLMPPSMPSANRICSIFRWRLTLLRRGKHTRVEVQYSARGQCATILSN